jgi:hypothetical protein
MNADKIKTKPLYCFHFVSALIGVYLRLNSVLVLWARLYSASPWMKYAADSSTLGEPSPPSQRS